MTVCTYCNQEMTHGVGCTVGQFVGEPARLPNSDEAKCHDCHCPPGTLHHPGCDQYEAELAAMRLTALDHIPDAIPF
jgi:hypothetical protein